MYAVLEGKFSAGANGLPPRESRIICAEGGNLSDVDGTGRNVCGREDRRESRAWERDVERKGW